MRKDLLDFVKELTKLDHKSLTEKALKTVEEVGELARKVLPFENASTTKHRIFQEKDIAEECVDTMLCVLSILYELNYEDDQIEQLLAEKATKWSKLQNRELKVKDKLPFEIHVTVSEPDCLEKFKGTCSILGVKPLLLELQNSNSGKMLDQVMTSSVLIGTNTQAIQESNRITSQLSKAGFRVTRQKIETVPWHPAAPSRDSAYQEMPKNCYFESHFNVKIKGNNTQHCLEQEETLKKFCQEMDMHFSKNVFKAKNPLEYTKMCTLRTYEGVYEDFEAKVARISSEIPKLGDFSCEKVIVEFSIYDSHLQEDHEWLLKAN